MMILVRIFMMLLMKMIFEYVVLFIKDAVKAGNYISHRPDNIPFMAFIQAKCSQTLLYFKRRTFCKTITTLTQCHLCNLGNATHRA